MRPGSTRQTAGTTRSRPSRRCGPLPVDGRLERGSHGEDNADQGCAPAEFVQAERRQDAEHPKQERRQRDQPGGSPDDGRPPLSRHPPYQ